MGAVGAAALPLFAEPARALDAVQRVAQTEGDELVVPHGLRAPNARAAGIAASSPFVRAQMAAIKRLCASIGNATLRDDVHALLNDPTPRYVQRYADERARTELRDALAREEFVAADAPVEGLFPASGGGLAQPFWSAPGSDDAGHHGYPGGLCVHELFNARMGEQFAQVYDRQYFDARGVVDRDVAIAAALYHDVMKTVVFQYRSDGTFLPELTIAGTGAHHTLSAAEAILRGRDARFVTVLLSAHAAPSLGDEKKVVRWCRAAAIIAGVDPVAFGLVRKMFDEYTLAHPAPIEAFVNHLSDHDYVLSIHAAREVKPRLAVLQPDPWWTLRVLSHTSAIALYHELTRGDAAFRRAIARVV